MKKKGLFVMAAACLLAATSCSQDETGKQIISGKEMVLKVKVTPWDAKAVDLPEKFITGTATAAFKYSVGGGTVSTALISIQ